MGTIEEKTCGGNFDAYHALLLKISIYSAEGDFMNKSVSMAGVKIAPTCFFFNGGLKLDQTAEILSSSLSNSILLNWRVIRSAKNKELPIVYFTCKSLNVEI